jgi:hypothetical protein
MQSDDNKGDVTKHMQLLLKTDSITVHASLMQAVLITQTFEGNDCYLKLVNFLKQVYPDRSTPISAEIIVN